MSEAAQFHVYQVFVGGEFERVTPEPIAAREAVSMATDLTKTVGARIGSTCRVFVTDSGDFVVWEWRYGEGVAFPSRDEV